jgi:hypothetical protein
MDMIKEFKKSLDKLEKRALKLDEKRANLQYLIDRLKTMIEEDTINLKK